jgi:hypothetical protein
MGKVFDGEVFGMGHNILFSGIISIASDKNLIITCYILYYIIFGITSIASDNQVYYYLLKKHIATIVNFFYV